MYPHRDVRSFVVVLLPVVFFFSSRRRHTRCLSDWSSDVCSSDLYSGDAISMYTHCGTHIDTLNHFGYNGVIWNGYKASEHLGARHWNVCGADKFPPIIARGVMLDIAGLKGVDTLPPSYGIGADDIR